MLILLGLMLFVKILMKILMLMLLNAMLLALSLWPISYPSPGEYRGPAGLRRVQAGHGLCQARQAQVATGRSATSI